MRIGIIADTHDNLTKIKECVKILNERKIDFLLHCGDYIAPFSLNPFNDLSCDWIGVFGNNDGEKKGLTDESKERIKEPPYFLELSAKRIALTHEFKDYDADILAFAHTHQAKISNQGNKLLINPGEVGGWLYGKSGFVILDLDSLKCEIVHF